MLGLTIQFYSTCWSYFPSAGNRMFFPVKDFTEEQRIAGTYPYTSAILCRNQNVTARPCSTSTPSTRRLLDGVTGCYPHRCHLHLDQRRALFSDIGHPLPDALLGGGDEGSRVVLLDA